HAGGAAIFGVERGGDVLEGDGRVSEHTRDPAGNEAVDDTLTCRGIERVRLRPAPVRADAVPPQVRGNVAPVHLELEHRIAAALTNEIAHRVLNRSIQKQLRAAYGCRP